MRTGEQTGGMRDRLDNTTESPSSIIDRSAVADSVMDWVNKLAGSNPIVFPIAHSCSNRTLPATDFAIFTNELLGTLHSVPKLRREQWQQYLLSCQDPHSGIFRDPNLQPGDLTSAFHNWDYVVWQMTFFTTSALDALDAFPAYPLRFLEPYRSRTAITAWLEQLDWSNPWLESNRVMFLSSFLIQAGETSLANTIFDWLDNAQDQESGYWGMKQGASRFDAMAGAFHFYFLYFYLGRPVRYADQIIDNTLLLQQPDGLYHPAGGGGACHDLDAIDILVKFSMLTDYRAQDIKASLRQSYAALRANQRHSGAFCEAVRKPPSKSAKRRIAERTGLDRLLRKPYTEPYEIIRYAGWTKMEYSEDEGDLWSTWFRLLALALISSRYPGEFSEGATWFFRRGPFLGWHNTQQMWVIRNRLYS